MCPMLTGHRNMGYVALVVFVSTQSVSQYGVGDTTFTVPIKGMSSFTDGVPCCMLHFQSHVGLCYIGPTQAPVQPRFFRLALDPLTHRCAQHDARSTHRQRARAGRAARHRDGCTGLLRGDRTFTRCPLDTRQLWPGRPQVISAARAASRPWAPGPSTTTPQGRGEPVGRPRRLVWERDHPETLKLRGFRGQDNIAELGDRLRRGVLAG